MPLSLTPIKNLIIASIALHIASLFAVAILIALQHPLGTLFTTEPLPFTLPTSITIITTLIFFMIHGAITFAFWKALNPDALSNPLQLLKTASILSFVFVIIIIPVLSHISAWLEMVLRLTTYSVQILTAHTILRQLMFYGFGIRSLALMALIVAASMAYYYCLVTESHEKENSHV
ncbi:MAG: hypothetical protein FWD03_08835 [Defluviitaleaceae bacterium]|nr:hypothetical protein [Defluviitaleaceae bacterium]